MIKISDSSVKELQKIKNELWNERRPKEKDLNEISEYINPDMGGFGDKSDPQKDGKAPDTGKFRYDTTVMNASSLAADGAGSYAFGRSTPWFRTALEEGGTDGDRGYLQIVEKQLYKQFARSPFYDEGRLFMRSLFDFATAVMFRIENVEFGIPVFRTLHLKRCYLGEDMFGDVDVLVREVWLSPQDAISWFGIENVPEDVNTAYKSNKTSRFMFDHYLFPNGKFDIDYESQGKNYTSVYVADCRNYKAVRVGGFESKPFYAARFARAYDGGAWGGSSPGMLQLSNVKQLNGMIRDRRKLSQRIADPGIKATEGMYGKIKNSPGGVTYVPVGQDYTYTQIAGRLQELDQDIVDLRKAINEAYHSDFFFILSQNIERIKTATEASGIQGEKAAMLAAFFGRLGYEFLDPVIEDLFMMEVRAGRIPPPPAHMMGQNVNIDYISPLYQMQKQYLTLASTRQALAEIATLAKIQTEAGKEPDVLDNFDLDAYSRVIAETYNMDKNVVRELIDVEKMRQARAKQKQAMLNFQIQAEQQKMQNERAKTLADVASKAPQVAQNMQGGK